MTRKRWAVLTLALLISALLGIIGAVVLIDPFEIYHRATAFIPPITNGTQNYSNAGVGKSYDYDSVIIGSSMTENFTPSQLDRLLGGSFIKLPINGGSAFNNKQMMDLAFGTHDIRTVLYGLDLESMTYFYKTPKCEMPEYLYDDSLFNDVQYWFNRSVLAIYIPRCLRTLGQRDDTLRDTMYNWGDLYTYGRDAVLPQVSVSSAEVAQGPLMEDPELSPQFMLNMEHNILPYIQGHPDTQFIFFFPPYSLLRWYGYYAQGSLNDFHVQKEAVIEALLPYENVRIYDFQAEIGWITDLNNYIDDGHYGPWINDAIVEAINEDRRRITSVAQAQENDAVIREYVERLRLLGAWPDSFDP